MIEDRSEKLASTRLETVRQRIHHCFHGTVQVTEYCFRRALKGSARHAELFLNYTEGKPKQGFELSGPDGGAMKFENMSEAELDARLKELLEKYQQGKKG